MLGIFIAVYVSIGVVLAGWVLWDKRSRLETLDGQMWMGLAALWMWPFILIIALVKYLNALHVYKVSSPQYIQAVAHLTEERQKREKCQIQ